MPLNDRRAALLAQLIADHGEQRSSALLGCTLTTLRDKRIRVSLVRIVRAINKGKATCHK